MVGFEPTEYGIQIPGSYHLTTSECNSRYGRSRTFLTYTILLTKLFATKLCFRVYTNRTSPPAHHAGEGATSFCRIVICSSSNRLRLIELLSSERISHFKSVSFCVTEVTASRGVLDSNQLSGSYRCILTTLSLNTIYRY